MIELQVRGRFLASYSIKGVHMSHPTTQWNEDAPSSGENTPAASPNFQPSLASTRFSDLEGEGQDGRRVRRSETQPPRSDEV